MICKISDGWFKLLSANSMMPLVSHGTNLLLPVYGNLKMTEFSSVQPFCPTITSASQRYLASIRNVYAN